MRKIVLGIMALFVLSTVAYAAPELTINSPANTTYSEYGPIQINVTSNETVGFHIVSSKGRKLSVGNGAELDSNFYGRKGSYNLTVFSNNSNGKTTKSVVFTIDHDSVINVTTCGFLGSPNTTFVLLNDIEDPDLCLEIGADALGSTLDLNGFQVKSEATAITASCYDFELFNGTIIADLGIEFEEGTKCRVMNVTIEADEQAITAQFFSSSLLENIYVKNVTTAIIMFESTTNLFLKNLTLTTNKEDTTAIEMEVFDSIVTIENSNINGFTNNIRFIGVGNVDIYMKNNNMTLNNIAEDSDIAGRVRIFKEHLLKITTRNILDQPIAASVELIDNGQFTRGDREHNTYTFDSNPTGNIYVGTDENGTAEEWITERLITVTTSSPPSFEETIFSPYTLIGRAGANLLVLSEISVIANSTITSNFTIDVSASCGNSTSLPVCDISVMLDLNNDTTVDSKDAKVINTWKVGHNVTVNGTKSCEAINFVPV